MKKRNNLFIANWKMNHTVEESIKFLTRFQKELLLSRKIDVVICPPFTSLYSLSVILSESKGIMLGAQNCHWEDHGAYTGEISPLFLKELQCEWVLLGHSERRQYFSETDGMLNKKIKAAISHEITPVLCVGESLQERESGRAFDRVLEQLTLCLEGVKLSDHRDLVVAYEPIWAIGTGQNATADQANQMHGVIRGHLRKQFGEMANLIPVIYGGSVKPENIADLMKEEEIDGVLVGGASLSVDTFIKIVN